MLHMDPIEPLEYYRTHIIRICKISAFLNKPSAMSCQQKTGIHWIFLIRYDCVHFLACQQLFIKR